MKNKPQYYLNTHISAISQIVILEKWHLFLPLNQQQPFQEVFYMSPAL